MGEAVESKGREAVAVYCLGCELCIVDGVESKIGEGKPDVGKQAAVLFG